MHKTILTRILVFGSLVFFAACSSTPVVPLFEFPPDWMEKPTMDKTIGEYSKYLSGKVFFLDPGHGGEDRKNTNPKGDVIEADVNLRVSLALKKYLEQAGAQVIMSRDKDATVALGYRSELANNSGAHFFISVHHNAPGKAEDVSTNYTSVYYHAKETDYEHDPNNKDMARYIARDLSYVMRNAIGLGSFDGSYSDYNIYPGEGFSVLRKTTIPAVLIEGAFHTSRFEELRLNNEEFNQIQAWGVFRGLGRYFKAGIPQIEFLKDSTNYDGAKLQLQFALKDTAGINHRSISIFFNKEEKDFSFDKTTGLLRINLEKVLEGENIIKVVCANKNGNYSLPYRKKIIIKEKSIELAN
jgi:N-acetylmuramoyl-L-alanine amidase